jgi:threonine dehydrogenase-like Zn-dependent dehydrogenase
MGHENVGVIAKLGRVAAERWGVKEGDRVALEEYVTCGSCRWCRSENFRYCHLTDSAGAGLRYGSTSINVAPGLWGGYSEYLYMHPGAVIHRMPSHVPAELATPFLPMANGVSLACAYGGTSIGNTVLIQGPGEHGIAAVMAAKASGAACIIVAGLSMDESRLQICERVGAHFTIDVEKEDLVDRVRQITGGEGADVVLNITGAGTKTAEQSLACAAKVATIVLSDAGDETIALKSFGRRELTIKSSNGHSYASVEAAISMIASGDYPIAELTAPPYTLDQASQAVDAVEGLVDRSITFATILPRLSQ